MNKKNCWYQPFVTIALLGFFLEFSPKIQKGVLYLVSIVINIATVTIGGTLCGIVGRPNRNYETSKIDSGNIGI